MCHNVADKGAGVPLPLASDPVPGGNCCGGLVCEPGAAAPLTAPPEPPEECCGGLVCVPITDEQGRALTSDDWGWWQRHLGYQAPRPGQIPVYEENRRRFLELARYVHSTLPPGEDRDYTLRQLGLVLMSVNNTIAAHGVGLAAVAATGD